MAPLSSSSFSSLPVPPRPDFPPPGAKEVQPSEHKGGEIKAKKTKEEKRREAEERNRISKATANLKRELGKTEARISLLEGKKRETEGALCETEIYQQPERLKQMNLDLRAIDAELEDLYYAWNDLTLKIEAWEESLPSSSPSEGER